MFEVLTFLPSSSTKLESGKGFSNRPIMNLTLRILLTASSIRLMGMAFILTREVRSLMNSLYSKGTITCKLTRMKKKINDKIHCICAMVGSRLLQGFKRQLLKDLWRGNINHINAGINWSQNRIRVVCVWRCSELINSLPVRDHKTLLNNRKTLLINPF